MSSLKYRVRHQTTYEYSTDVQVSLNQVMLTPRDSSFQRKLWHHLRVDVDQRDTSVPLRRRNDYYGNSILAFSFERSHKVMKIASMSNVEVDRPPAPEIEQAPVWDNVAQSVRSGVDPSWFEAKQFALASRRINPNPDFEQYARDCFPSGGNILECALRLTERVYTEFKYAPGATDVNTPAETALSQKHGVCQDFAHVQIACLRSIGLSARYVSGYLRTLPPPGKPRLVGADQSHAWISLYCGPLGWVDLDPTNNCIPGSEHITIAHGRDYEDVVPVRGVFLGGGSHKISVSVDVEPF